MTKFLITRCTTFDMAGLAMINGAIAGLSKLYPDAEFATIVNLKDHKEIPGLKQFVYPHDIAEAAYWPDCCIDLGGLCKGSDIYRREYIGMCRIRDIPYIYMAVSFEDPEPAIVKGIPATARGIHSSAEYTKSSGMAAAVVPDISFLIEPKPSFLGHGAVCYTTHKGKPWHKYLEECMDCEDTSKMLQIIFKPEDALTDWEPRLPIVGVNALPEELYGTIANAKEVKTCRYHAAVAAIMASIPVSIPIDMPNFGKYEDLMNWRWTPLAKIRAEAFYSCEFVKEVLHG